MTLLKKRSSRGFTLVELMIVVAIIGILAALAIAGVKKYLTSAKSSEARNSLGTMSTLASQVWSGEAMVGAVLADGATVGTTHSLCGDTEKVPTSQDLIKGMKYQSSTDPTADFHKAAWKCLGFSLEAPQYYQYQYLKTTSTAEGGFNTIAQGDLNGNGTLSKFERPGDILNGSIKLSPAIIETDPDE